ncbi:MAG: ATPase, T2SS/T4P/T4SS family [Myxococcales bacterium]|nr:ATPase, T2SS/T4P/T4SS family [Myxococcota bacterium]MDW8282497.1 ATPase, T2SS/T4P/T4SS family [Myxococcales bacterium]
MSSLEPIPEKVFAETLAGFLAPVQRLLDDVTVSEILINSPSEIYYEQRGRLYRSDARFESEEDLLSLCQNLAQYVGKTLSYEKPFLEARLPDGSRVAVVAPPAARGSLKVSIRRFARERLRPEQLISWGSATQEVLDFLKACLHCKRNTVVAGGTGSGKTTLLNVLSSFFPDDERIIVMEDVSELQVQKDHVVYLETRPPDHRGRGEVTMRDLLRAVLRLRPDRIIVGEIRGGEAMDLVQALTTGHGGSMTTLHANHAIDAMHRLETMCLMSDINLPVGPLRSQIISAIDVIVQQNRLRDGSRRIVGVYESERIGERGEYVLRPLFQFQYEGLEAGTGRVLGKLVPTGNLPSFADDIEARGFQLPAAMRTARRGGRP